MNSAGPKARSSTSSQLDHVKPPHTESPPTVWTNFSLDVSVEQTLVFPISEKVNVQALTKRLKISDWQYWEKLLRNLRIKTMYIKDSKEPNGIKTKLLKIRGFGRQPELNKDGKPDIKDKKLQLMYRLEGKPGDAKDLMFLHNDGKLISVNQYFFESESSHQQATSEAYMLSRTQSHVDDSNVYPRLR